MVLLPAGSELVVSNCLRPRGPQCLPAGRFAGLVTGATVMGFAGCDELRGGVDRGPRTIG